MRQLLLAVKELHSCSIVQVNLNPRSIYLGSDHNIKITNFAHSKDLKDMEHLSHVDKLRFQEYVAPEVLNKKGFGIEADVYSLGLIFAFIRYGRIDN